jgi:PBSX family phage terminase large subunit
MQNKIQIKLSPKISTFFAENQNAKIYILYGGRMSGKTWSAVKVYLYRVLYSGRDGLVVREVEDKMSIGIHKTFKDVIQADDFLTEHFEVLNTKIRVKEQSIFAKTHGKLFCIDFGGLKGRGQGLKGLGAYSYLFVDEAVELSEEQAVILRGTLMRNKDLVSFYCFNPQKASDWIYNTFIENYEKVKDVYQERLAVLKVNWYDNTFLSQEVVDEILAEKAVLRYEVYQHYYEGELALDIEGALFTGDNINSANNHDFNGKTVEEIREMLDYVVIGVDPAVSTGAISDKTGIIVAGIAITNGEKTYFVLEDATGKHTPSQWASKVEYLWNKWNANYVIAEGNQGGNLVKDNLLNVGTRMYIDVVHARFGKTTRAEPVQGLYGNNQVKHINFYDYNKNHKGLGELETQMMTYSPFSKAIRSPDNMDAMVWALTKLMAFKHNTFIFDEDVDKYMENSYF